MGLFRIDFGGYFYPPGPLLLGGLDPPSDPIWGPPRGPPGPPPGTPPGPPPGTPPGTPPGPPPGGGPDPPKTGFGTPKNRQKLTAKVEDLFGGPGYTPLY